MKPIAFGCDHRGYEMVHELADWSESQGYSSAKFGASSTEAYDYPLAADAIAREIVAGRSEFGVLVCGSGIGVCIRANRFKGVRAAHCMSVAMAIRSRAHNHANVLCLGSDESSVADAKAILQAFLLASEDESDRHVRRVKQLDGPTDVI